MRRCRILLAEDDAASREMLTEFLRLQGHIVLAAGDGAAAIAFAKRFQPDVVVTDICMPGLNGVEVCRQLHLDPATQELPVLAITALPAHEWHEVIKAGFEAVLPKPVELEELEQQIVAACDPLRKLPH